MAIGVVAVGQVAVGAIAIGQFAAGLALGIGQLAFAWAALGQFAAGAGWVLGQAAAGPGADGTMFWNGATSLAVLFGAWGATASILVMLGRRARGRVAPLLPPRRASIANARPGQVLLSGRVVAVTTVQAPLSRVSCVGFDLRRFGENHEPRDERRCEDFVLDDGSGRARIIASDVELLLDARRRGAQAVQRVVAVAKGSNSAHPVRSHQATRRTETCLERALLPGDRVVIAGHAMRTVGGGGSDVLQLVVHGGGSGPVLVTNRDVNEMRAESALSFWLASLMTLASLSLLVLVLIQ